MTVVFPSRYGSVEVHCSHSTSTVSDPKAEYVGTEPWKPKEALEEEEGGEGGGEITDKADIFAYGLTLWEMMTLAMPHLEMLDFNDDGDDGGETALWPNSPFQQPCRSPVYEMCGSEFWTREPVSERAKALIFNQHYHSSSLSSVELVISHTLRKFALREQQCSAKRRQFVLIKNK